MGSFEEEEEQPENAKRHTARHPNTRALFVVMAQFFPNERICDRGRLDNPTELYHERAPLRRFFLLVSYI
jgi:hypothetical protein